MRAIALICLLSIQLFASNLAYSSYGHYFRHNESRCNPELGPCACTDNYCRSIDRKCMSESKCCQVFGNVGADN